MQRHSRRRRPDDPAVFFAACPPGTETALLAEARRLRLGKAEARTGGVEFRGRTEDGWRACLHLRVAVRVYRRLAQFSAPTGEDLYRGAQSVDWGKILTCDQTFAVDAKVSDSAHRHSGFVGLKVKDAVADWFRSRHGVRPSVDPVDPDARLFAHVHADRCTLSVDVGGRSLHRRGYRTAATAAPIGESLAAAAVELSGWDERSPFLDPFCGSGTLVIEAGLRAARIPPGLLDPEFAFTRRPGFDPNRWEAMLEESRRGIKLPSRLILRGSDRDPAAVEAARQNARAAGVHELIRFEVADIHEFSPTPGWGATVVSNPPYGVRLQDTATLVPLYETLGRVLKERCRGFHVHLFLASGRLAKALRLKPDRYWSLVNGGLKCRLVRYEIR